MGRLVLKDDFLGAILTFSLFCKLLHQAEYLMSPIRLLRCAIFLNGSIEALDFRVLHGRRLSCTLCTSALWQFEQASVLEY